jgi:RNA polymerase sigma-70 factor (ECF subfamily)
VYGAALQLVQSSRLATIVTEEVYVEVWRLAPRYDPSESSVLAWMMTMAHRRSTHEVEARAGRPASEQPADANDQSDRVARQPDGSSHPHAERARRALSALRDPHRQAVVLAYFGGCSQGEVARILELPVSQVSTRIRHGLVGLRRELEVAG